MLVRELTELKDKLENERHIRDVLVKKKTGVRYPSPFRVQGSRFRVQGPGFRVQGPGFRVQGPGNARGIGDVLVKKKTGVR